MEVLSRLRVLIWILLLSLWGIMVYQYLGDDQGAVNWAFLSRGETSPPLSQVNTSGNFIAHEHQNPFPQPSPQEDANPSQGMVLPTAPPGDIGAAPPAPSVRKHHHPKTKEEEPAPQEEQTQQTKPNSAVPIQSGENISRPANIPPGFVQTETRHFTVYSEDQAAPQKFLSMAELLHGNLMLDLASFSPWAFDQKVTIVLFKNQKTYHEVTGRPEWSGGATSVERREIFVYSSPDLQSILAHEMCHVYYDGFYLEGREDPMWLSEGMATYIQIERGLTKPNWLRPNMEILEEGGGYSLKQLTNVTTLSGASDAEVQLWYAESYSVVRFLVHMPPRSGFYKFSVAIREGRSVDDSLLAGFGMPYNRVQALEYAWRFALAKNSLRHVGENFPTPALELNLNDE